MTHTKAPQNAKPTPSLPKVGDLVARRLAVRILLASLSAMAALVIGVAILSGLTQIHSIQYDAEAMSKQLARSMQFFDYAPAIGMINAFTDGHNLAGAAVLDSSGRIIAANLADLSPMKSALSVQVGHGDEAIWFSLAQGWPMAWVETAITTPADLPLGSLIVAIPFGTVLKYVMVAVVGFALFVTLLLVWIARTTRLEVTRSLAPIEKLTAAFNQVASLNELSIAGFTPDSVEVKSLVDAYDRMIAALQQATALEADHQRALAVAQTTQMLAHDVRKPFSILTMGLKSLSMASDAEQIKHLVERMVPEVDRALSGVNGMITDIMEMGAKDGDTLREPVSPQALLEASLGDLFRLFPNASIALSYQLNHTYMVDVDSQKVLRVFLNILSNALQAMNQKGSLWFHTRDVKEAGRDFVEFCLGNNGPAIASENLPKLFDAFYTTGKRGGTGLGLAIAQKVITAHGGRIACRSRKPADEPRGEVEFWFTLPVVSLSPNTTTSSLPDSSDDFAAALAALRPLQNLVSTSIHRSERELEGLVVDLSRKLRRPLRVLVIDDEAVYRNALAAFFVIEQNRSDIIALAAAAESATAMELVASASFDLIISDVDLGPASQDGFELVSSLRALLASQERRALICIHSNRIVAADHQAAADCGAHSFLPKPMARAQLLRLLLQAAQAAEPEAQADVAQAPESRCEIMIVEDNVFMLETWEMAIGSHSLVHALTGPEAFDRKLQEDPGILSRIACLVVDYYFDDSLRTGIDLGRLAKASRPDLPVILVTDARIPQGELQGAVDRVLAKEDLDVSLLAG